MNLKKSVVRGGFRFIGCGFFFFQLFLDVRVRDDFLSQEVRDGLL